MKTKLLLITAAFLLLSGCKTKQSFSHTENTALDRFKYVVGIKKGDTIERVFEIYGEPTDHRIHENEYDFNTVHYYVAGERALSFSYNKRTHKVGTIYVNLAAADLLKQKNIEDTLYIGVHGDKIIKLFGPKEYGHVQQLEYNRSEYQVVFYCYNFNKYECHDYTIYWWH
ncbi:hypothetical protein [Dysgonomonas sp. 511]|uniref:hypothetical protein n=1 Tax=Dysgonomonas sp. 511 TaxID=2302930 RepID=UPI0013D84F32|nr:hypothetical protein [Dysgonomonas sp. 511]NDV78210.1 hypothetical protein [Dysgonomonas sp. 511]